MAEFRYSRYKSALLALFTGILTLALLVGAVGPGMLAARLVLLGTALVSGAWLAAMVARLMWRDAVLTLSPQGICDTRIGPHTIPWSAMQQVYAFRARSQLYLAVVLNDADRYIAPASRMDRLALKANDAIGLPRVSLSLMGLDASARHVLRVLRGVMPDGLEPDEPPRRGLLGW